MYLLPILGHGYQTAEDGHSAATAESCGQCPYNEESSIWTFAVTQGSTGAQERRFIPAWERQYFGGWRKKAGAEGRGSFFGFSFLIKCIGETLLNKIT